MTQTRSVVVELQFNATFLGLRVRHAPPSLRPHRLCFCLFNMFEQSALWRPPSLPLPFFFFFSSSRERAELSRVGFGPRLGPSRNLAVGANTLQNPQGSRRGLQQTCPFSSWWLPVGSPLTQGSWWANQHVMDYTSCQLNPRARCMQC